MDAKITNTPRRTTQWDESWRGRLIVLSGPSGVGKTVLVDRLVERGVAKRAITATTRPPRREEQDGEDYRFYRDRESFLEDVRAGRFLEYATVHGHFYGTPIESVAEKLKSGEIVILNIDVQGARTLMEEGVPATFIFVEPPALTTLEARLKRRGTEDSENVALRLRNAERELSERDHYDHCVVNDELEVAVEELVSLVSEGEPLSGPGKGVSGDS